MITPFTTALAVISAVARADLSHEICSRSVDRLLHRNTDFNIPLSENTGSWVDPQFGPGERLYMPDNRTQRLGTQFDLESHSDMIEWKRIKDELNTG